MMHHKVPPVAGLQAAGRRDLQTVTPRIGKPLRIERQNNYYLTSRWGYPQSLGVYLEDQ